MSSDDLILVFWVVVGVAAIIGGAYAIEGLL